MKRLLLPLAGALLLGLPLEAADKPAIDLRRPEVGRIAPPIERGGPGGPLGWLVLGKDEPRPETDLAKLRGKVVVVADYGYYCDSCTRVGVPTLNALREANDRSELVTLMLTAAIGDDTAELIRSKGESLGLRGGVAMTDVEGEGSAYLDMNANGNLTYAYVIGRHGGIVWKGDPSRARDAYLEAVRGALHALPLAALPADPEAFSAPLLPALSEYVRGELQKCEATLAALTKKLGAKTTPDAEATRADVAELAALVEASRKKLMDELEITGGGRDVERFPRVLAQVRRAFPKGPQADRASQLEMFVTIQNDDGPACRRWSEWYALEEARPPTFPAEKSGPNGKYARELEKYLATPELPGQARAKAWLEAYRKVADAKDKRG